MKSSAGQHRQQGEVRLAIGEQNRDHPYATRSQWRNGVNALGVARPAEKTDLDDIDTGFSRPCYRCRNQLGLHGQVAYRGAHRTHAC